MNRILIASLLLLLLALPAFGAPVKARPYAGNALLIIHPPAFREPDKPAALIVYRDPEIGRIAELTCDALPLLSRVIALPIGEYPVAVLGKKGTWLKIAYDDAGREGWLEMARRWEYIPWDEFLPGRTARLLPGLKKGFYAVRQTPDEAAAEIEVLPPEKAFRILEVMAGWVRVETGAASSGWLQWQDNGSRFLISVSERKAQQND